jgi:hypothetical protein
MNRRQWISIIAISLAALLAGVLTSQWIYKTGLASDPAIKAFLPTRGKRPMENQSIPSNGEEKSWL